MYVCMNGPACRICSLGLVKNLVPYMPVEIVEIVVIILPSLVKNL